MENFELGGGGRLNSRKKSAATLVGIFILCTCIGTIAGNYLKHQTGTASASSTNITVTNNNQISTIDQGTPTIVRSSTVTVKDPTATLGYTLSARVSQNTIPNSTISIYSTSSTTCTQSSPCTITNNPTPTTILETNNNNATAPQGDTTQWTVTITMPTNTSQGNYLLDIAYSEDPIIPPTLSDITNMQDATQAICANTTPGTTVSLKDNRDGKYYGVRKMVDSRCWMIDNLAYDINAAPSQGKPTYNPTAQLLSGTAANSDNIAQYARNNNVAGQGQIPNNGTPIPSYLYNWCAAMGDTSANCATTRSYTLNQPATPQTGICPAPFRLPIVGANVYPSIPVNNSNKEAAAASTTNEFAKLDIWMGGIGQSIGGGSTYLNFTTDSATNPQLFWSGVFSGFYNSGLINQGGYGRWWSSTAYSGTESYYAGVSNNPGYLELSSANVRYNAMSVRCIL